MTLECMTTGATGGSGRHSDTGCNVSPAVPGFQDLVMWWTTWTLKVGGDEFAGCLRKLNPLLEPICCAPILSSCFLSHVHSAVLVLLCDQA
jgi:hypothetical protein